MELELIKFLKSHPNNWKEILKDKPYGLIIKEENNLVLFKYTMWDSDFSEPIVNECRGLILERDTWRPICVPFFKFFNYNEPFNDTEKIDWKSAKVQTKIDGSIIKLYFYDNKWNIATNSMINAFEVNSVSPKIEESTEVKSFGDLFAIAAKKQNLNYDILDKDKTYIFELTSIYNEQVVHYDGIQIWHLGTRNLNTLEEENINIGIQKPKEWPLTCLNDCIKIASNFKDEQEGFVVVDKNYNRIKIKSPYYFLKSHELNDNVSVKKLVDIFLSGDYEEFLAYFPKYIDLIKKLERKLKSEINILDNKWVEYSKMVDLPKRDFYNILFKNNENHVSFFMNKFSHISDSDYNMLYTAKHYLLHWTGLRKYLINYLRTDF